MPSDEVPENKTPHLPEDYDSKIAAVLPYYRTFHDETIYLVRSLPEVPEIWMDTGCGTGTFVSKAIEQFPDTGFLMVDPSEGMLKQAREKLSSCPCDRIEILEASATQDLTLEPGEQPDVITAIQCHHYLDMENRKKAVGKCYELLKDGGIFITFENISPFTEEGIDVGKGYWRDFQSRHGRTEEEIGSHLDRFGTEYFPITVEEHLELLRETGFRTVELFWYSYMQAGFYCIK
ncbi:class I SAM-dependent methyltransferase [Methanolobus sp. WCC4]|uniref:class I SAM-dependent methyltransferase n=1 Tax=Methanolobus sp. WCC4 TaxID=3125784 RepID=UPI0030FCD33D